MHDGPAARRTVVVTISRELASGGSYIGQAVAARLGLKYADRTILERAAQLLDQPKEDLATLEERGVSLWERVAYLWAVSPPEGLFVPPIRPDPWNRLYDIESRVMSEMAAQDDVVIVGRAAFHVLRDHPGVVRVFVHAPEAWRVQRLMEVYHIGDEATAREFLKQNDANRARFIETLAGCPWREAMLSFDLGVNTATLGLDAAADLVCQVVKQRLDERDATTAAHGAGL
jgi:CMP/dCMP kinase